MPLGLYDCLLKGFPLLIVVCIFYLSLYSFQPKRRSARLSTVRMLPLSDVVCVCYVFCLKMPTRLVKGALLSFDLSVVI